MGIRFALFKQVWKTNEKKDNRRIARQTPTSGVVSISDIPYIADKTRAHLLDVYYPERVKGKDARLPVIIDIHGGGWMYGYKEINKNYNLYLASAGYTVFSVNYRLVPEVCMAEQLQDIFAALQWIDTHLTEYPCDRNNVYLTGDSAGGQLAAFTAVIDSSAVLRQAFSVPASELSFNAVCLTSPACDMDAGGLVGYYAKPMLGKDYKKKPYAKYLSFEALLKAGTMPPCFLVSSTGDFVAKNSTKKAAKLIEQSGAPYKFMYWNKHAGLKLSHVFAVIDPTRDESVMTINRMLEFFDKYAVRVEKTAETN